MDGIEPSGIGSVCLLLGEFSSPNPVSSIFGVSLSSVALTVIYIIPSFTVVVNHYLTKIFFYFISYLANKRLTSSRYAAILYTVKQ